MTRFEPVNAASERAHHMLLYTCDGIVNDGTWDCRHHRVCGSGGPVRKEEGVALVHQSVGSNGFMIMNQI